MYAKIQFPCDAKINITNILYNLMSNVELKILKVHK